MLGRGILNGLSQRRLIGPIARRFRSAHPLGEPPAERAEDATAGLVRIVEAVHRTAPAARCILVDYLPVFTEFTVPGDGVPFDTDEIAHFRRVADVLSGVYREAGDRSGAEVLHSSEYDGGHGAGSNDPWVFGLRPIRRLGSSFHPTPAGMRAVAFDLSDRADSPVRRPQSRGSTDQCLRPVVDDAPHLADGPFDAARVDNVDGHRHADVVLHQFAQRGTSLIPHHRIDAWAALHPDRQLVHPTGPGKVALEVRRERRHPQDEFLDLRGEEVHPAENDHVIAAPGDLLDAPHRPRGSGQQPGQVSGAVAHHRHRLLRQRGENQLPVGPIGQYLPGDRVDDLREEMVFPDVQSILGVDAFDSHARPDDLRQPVDVDGVHIQPGLHFQPHVVRPRLGTEDAQFQGGLGRIDTLPLHLVDHRQHVRRGDHDEVRFEIPDQRHLAFGHAPGNRDDRTTQPLRAIMGTQPAGEKAVPVGDVRPVTGPAARRANRAGHDVGPHVDIVRRVADHGGLAGGPGGGMNPGDPLPGYREHPERVIVPQVLLAGRREFRQICQAPGSHPGAPPPQRTRPGSAGHCRTRAAMTIADAPVAMLEARRPTPVRWGPTIPARACDLPCLLLECHVGLRVMIRSLMPASGSFLADVGRCFMIRALSLAHAGQVLATSVRTS